MWFGEREGIGRARWARSGDGAEKGIEVVTAIGRCPRRWNQLVSRSTEDTTSSPPVEAEMLTTLPDPVFLSVPELDPAPEAELVLPKANLVCPPLPGGALPKANLVCPPLPAPPETIAIFAFFAGGSASFLGIGFCGEMAWMEDEEESRVAGAGLLRETGEVTGDDDMLRVNRSVRSSLAAMWIPA